MLTFDHSLYLQIKGTAMGTIFAPTHANLTMGYHEIKAHSIICQSYALASKHFEIFWFTFSDDCQILLKFNLIKPDHLLSILNKTDNSQFTMEKSQPTLLFLDIMMKKSGIKIWMDTYNKPTDSKQYVRFTSNYPWHCLTNILFSLAKRICTIVESENVKEKCFKELKRTLLKQKCPKLLIGDSTLRAKEIPHEVLKQPKTTKIEETIPFTITYNPNNPNVFRFDNFQYSQIMSKVFQRKKFVKPTSQASNLGRLLCRYKF